MKNERTVKGAMLGAAIGSFIPGVGTIIGGIIGGWFGRQSEPEADSPEAQWVEYVQFTRLLVSAATTDGDRMPVARRRRLHDVLSMFCPDLPPQQQAQVVREATASRARSTEIAHILSVQAAYFAAPPLLFPLLMVYYAKQAPSTRDRKWLAEISANLDAALFSTAVSCFERGECTDDTRLHWLNALGLGAEATVDEVRTAWRQQAMEYHPDRLAGIPPALRKLAEEKMQQVNEAYKQLTANRHSHQLRGHLAVNGNGQWMEAVSFSQSDVAQCPVCTQQNRLPQAEHFFTSRCGRCSAFLMLHSDVVNRLVELTEATPPS